MINVDFIKQLNPLLKAEVTDKGINIIAQYGLKYNEKTSSYIFSERTMITNGTTKEISLVLYHRYFYDENGELLTDGWHEWYGFDRSLGANQTANVEDGFQVRLDKRPVSVSIVIEKVDTVNETALVHLPLPGEYLYQTIPDERINSLQMPMKINVGLAGGLSISFKECDDPEMIRAFMEAFRKVKIVSAGGMFMTDNDNSITFIYDDDNKYVVRFIGVNLELYIRHRHFLYVLSDHEELFMLMYKIVGRNDPRRRW